MIRARDIVKLLPKEQRAQFLALDPAEQALLINGSDEEKEQYATLSPEAARRYAQRPEAERKEEAKQGWRARRLERQAPAAVQAGAPAVDLGDVPARIVESARDLFELPAEQLERVQALAVNWLRSGAKEDEALDAVSAVLLDEEAPLPACEPPPSRMQVMFGAGNVLRV